MAHDLSRRGTAGVLLGMASTLVVSNNAIASQQRATGSRKSLQVLVSARPEAISIDL